MASRIEYPIPLAVENMRLLFVEKEMFGQTPRYAALRKHVSYLVEGLPPEAASACENVLSFLGGISRPVPETMMTMVDATIALVAELETYGESARCETIRDEMDLLWENLSDEEKTVSTQFAGTVVQAFRALEDPTTQEP